MAKNSADPSLYPQLGLTPTGHSTLTPYPEGTYEYVPPPRDSQNELKQPLIQSADHKHPQTSLHIVLYLVFIIIEYTLILAIAYKSYLFEYCYWDFGIIKFRKDVDKDLSVANYGGEISNMYAMLLCYDQDEVPECPDLCNLALDLKNSQFYLQVGLLLHIIVTFIGLILYLLPFQNPKKRLTQKGVIILQFGSFSIIFCTALAYIAMSGLITLREPEESLIDYNEPKELDIEIGGFIAFGLLLYMLAYRTILSILAK